MSEVKRYYVVSGRLCDGVPLGMIGVVLVADFDRVTAERDAALALSVTKIMLDVVPGYDGMGEEVYAKSVEDVEHAFTKLCDEVERLTDQRDALQQRLTAADERADHNARVSAIAVEDVLLLQRRVDVLEGLVGEVLDAVGREPLDLDAVLRLRARMRAALKPAEGRGDDIKPVNPRRILSDPHCSECGHPDCNGQCFGDDMMGD